MGVVDTFVVSIFRPKKYRAPHRILVPTLHSYCIFFLKGCVPNLTTRILPCFIYSVFV